jgi:hypothetical protein
MKNKKEEKKKTSVQISEDIHKELKLICENNGYKLSGFVENLAKAAISGSKKQQLNG